MPHTDPKKAREYHKAYEAKRKGTPARTLAARQASKRFYAKLSPEQRRDRWLHVRYGLSLADVQVAIQQQAGCCAICNTPFASSHDTCVDHDHKTEQVRGILCRKCNVMLGQARDRIDVLQKAIQYLIAHGTLT